MRALPRRKKAVVKDLVRYFGVILTKTPTAIRNHGIGKEAEDMILSFLSIDVISDVIKKLRHPLAVNSKRFFAFMNLSRDSFM